MEAFFNDTTTQPRTNDAPRAEQNPRPATEKATEARPPETGAAPTPAKSSRHVRVESPSPSKDTQRPAVTPVKPPANNGTTSRSYGTPKAPMAQPSPSKKIQYVPTQTQDASLEGGPQPTVVPHPIRQFMTVVDTLVKPSQYKGEESVHGVRRMTIRQLQNAKKDFSASLKDVFKTEDDYSYITVSRRCSIDARPHSIPSELRPPSSRPSEPSQTARTARSAFAPIPCSTARARYGHRCSRSTLCIMNYRKN